MTAALTLFDVLKDARPAKAHHSKEPAKAQSPALKAIRFSVELPELGGAVELSPWVGFEPVLCIRCGAVRATEQLGPRHVSVLPCGCNS